MAYKKGERVKHPTKYEWGVGQVLADSAGGSITIFFSRIGEKTLSLDYVTPRKVVGEEAVSAVLDSLNFDTHQNKAIRCRNCGNTTNFGETANSQRVAQGWCEPCFRHSQRTFDDRLTGEKRYFDELRTVDGIKGRFSKR
jgi:hypothetical protein